MLFASQHGLILIFLKISEKWEGYSPPSPPCSAALDCTQNEMAILMMYSFIQANYEKASEKQKKWPGQRDYYHFF